MLSVVVSKSKRVAGIRSSGTNCAFFPAQNSPTRTEHTNINFVPAESGVLYLLLYDDLSAKYTPLPNRTAFFPQKLRLNP